MTRRSVWLIVSSMVLGPALGGVTFMALAGITEAMAPPLLNPSTVFGIYEYWPIIIVASYVLGAIPGLASALFMIILTPRLPRFWQRLLAAPVVGGVISAASLSLLFLGEGIFGSLDGLMVVGVITASGAVAAVACMAIIELFHPLPAPAKAAA